MAKENKFMKNNEKNSMMEKEIEVALAKETGLSVEVVHACNFSKERLTALYNKVGMKQKRQKRGALGTCFLLASLGGIVVSGITKNPVLCGAATTVFVASFIAGMACFYKRDQNMISQEVRKAADQRLIELDKKDRGGQEYTPKL